MKPINNSVVIGREGLDQLITVLDGMGYQVVGPKVRDEAIVYENLKSIKDLPEGWTDEQNGGIYRLKKRSDNALFGFIVGPHSWKKYLHPPTRRLWQAESKGNEFQVIPETKTSPKFAFIGVRSCELHAILIQDKVFMNGEYVDQEYKIRRENAFIVAVNCGQAGNACFCISMKTGPRVESGFDLVMTEILDDNRHYFVVEAGSEHGVEVMKWISREPAGDVEVKSAERVVANASEQMGRVMDTEGIHDLLMENYNHSLWNDVAERCLSCANCTMVCPTCFCSTVEDVTDVTGNHAERWQKWDSCFTMDFTNLHGGSVRSTTKSRYRQWITHKLATWIDQFDSSGCVGCGRCITWCPPGIDITEEVQAIRESVSEKSGSHIPREDNHDKS